MTNLPQLTVVAVTTKDYGSTFDAIRKTLQHITPLETLFFSDVEFKDPQISHRLIDRFTSVKDYNRFMVKELGKFLITSHVLVVQHDGYVINGDAWRDEFLEYDYIGAPWTYTDGRNVGNGGFSLRSARLQIILATDPAIEMYSPEDEVICRFYRQYLEEKHGIKFAPDHVAHKFSFEMHKPMQPTFGFHNYFHAPYKEPVILQRKNSCLGDTIMLEPVMEELHKKGYRVILDTPYNQFGLFAQQLYPVEHIEHIYANEDTSNYRVINFDMAYEITPQQPVLASYFKVAQIDAPLRNSKLNFRHAAENKSAKFFDKYVVLHVDDTDMAHRNVHGVDWEEVANYIQVFLGYPVLRVGRGNGVGGLKVNTPNESMLAYVVGNADYFIGIDSGCAHIAVACQTPSMIFFGSVNPKLRYTDFSKIKVMQRPCPIVHDGCYHSVVSQTGKECEIDAKRPPCIDWKTLLVIDHVKQFIPSSL